MSSFLKRIVRLSAFGKVLTIILLMSLALSYAAPFVHPNTFKLLPIFGLGYPILIVCTLIFLIIWIIARSRMAILTLVVLLIGGKLHFRLLALGSEPAEIPAKEEQLHVLSYNVCLFDLYNETSGATGEKKAAIFNFLREQDPDIACFQEFYQQDKPTTFPTKDSIIKILKATDYHERFLYSPRGRRNFGVALFSKYPVITKGDVMFETTNTNNGNFCIYADIVKNQDTFRVYNVHLQSIRLNASDFSIEPDEEKVEKSTARKLIDKILIAFPARAEQARKVANHIKTSPYPTIVCGDFNDTPMSYTYNQFDQLLEDSFRETRKGIGATYIGKVPAGRIDYIFHSADLQASDFMIQKEELSDHRAISCKIFKK
ncbi:MAG: endonuclease/exonuclease/phosphatase family protein [Bacteroidota bacterium]